MKTQTQKQTYMQVPVPAEKTNYTYILRCCDGSFYCGWTNDLVRRLDAHNSGTGGKYTRSRLPVELAWYHVSDTKEQAMSLEAKIKRLSRQQKERLVSNATSLEKLFDL